MQNHNGQNFHLITAEENRAAALAARSAENMPDAYFYALIAIFKAVVYVADILMDIWRLMKKRER